MAKQRRKQTAEERAIIDAEREAAKLPEGVEVVVLEPTPEGMVIMHRAIAEAVGEEQPEEIQPEDVEQLEAELAEQEEPKEPVSIVKDKFKKRYIENAVAIGESKKAAKRSNWDWLAQQIAKFCLDDKGKIDIRAFVALLNVNEVDHSRWVNRNRGWEGRFRMTGRVALQKIVANKGFLYLPSEGTLPEPVEAPMEWRERYMTKA